MTHYASRDFQTRLEKLNEAKPKRVIRKKTFGETLAEKGRNALYPLSFVGAFALGMLAVFLVRFVRFQMAGPDSAESDFFLMDIFMSGFGAWGVAMMLKLRNPALKATQGFGVMTSIFFMHNLAFWAPQTMSALFSPRWVENQYVYALPNSINLMGSYVMFVRDSEPEPSLPKVTYMN